MYPAQSPVHHQPRDRPVLSPNGATPAENGDDEDSDEDAGVQVDVTEGPQGSYGVQTRASASAAADNRGRVGGQAKRGTTRRTR